MLNLINSSCQIKKQQKNVTFHHCWLWWPESNIQHVIIRGLINQFGWLIGLGSSLIIIDHWSLWPWYFMVSFTSCRFRYFFQVGPFITLTYCSVSNEVEDFLSWVGWYWSINLLFPVLIISAFAKPLLVDLYVLLLYINSILPLFNANKFTFHKCAWTDRSLYNVA